MSCFGVLWSDPACAGLISRLQFLKTLQHGLPWSDPACALTLLQQMGDPFANHEIDYVIITPFRQSSTPKFFSWIDMSP